MMSDSSAGTNDNPEAERQQPIRTDEESFCVDQSELKWRFSRSSGPGGQHVNTSDTRVEVLWHIGSATSLTDEQRALLRERLRARLNDDVLTVGSSRYRSQHRNRVDAIERLEALVRSALSPQRSRRKTKPTRASKRRWQNAKQQRSAIKQARRSSWD